MTEQTIFDQGTPAEVVTASVAPVVPHELADLVGDGKKYKTVDEALKSVPHAQKHISTLEEEMNKLKEELAKRRAVEELLDEVKSGIQGTSTQVAPEFNQDKVVETVTQLIEARQRAGTNVSKVVNAFNEKFGQEIGPEEYKKLAQETGISLAQLNQLAATSPDAVLRMAGLNVTTKESVPAKTQSTVNTQMLNNQSQSDINAKVTGRSTRDMVDAWKRAGEIINKRNLG